MKDRRALPFCFQEHRAVEMIHARWAGRERSKAIAIYQAMTYAASKRFRDGGREGFAASRTEIATLSGSKPATVDGYAADFISMGILKVERRRSESGATLSSVWILLSPEGVPLETHRGASTDTGGVPLEAYRCAPTEPVEAPPTRARPDAVEETRLFSSEPNGPEENATAESRNASPMYVRFAGLFAELLVANGVKPPTDQQKLAWRNDFRLLVEEDNRSPSEIEQVMRWTHADSFERGVVHSAGKFRKRYDELRLKSERGRRRTPSSSSEDWVRLNLPDLEGSLFHRAVWAKQALGEDATAETIRKRLRLEEAA